MKTITCASPVNIAVIKYWGKRNEELILPINDSISATLFLDHMCARTKITASQEFSENKFYLNNKEETFDNKRLQNCLQEIRKQANDKNILNWKIHIESENNFPTAAGLASSAAGYSCLVSALAKLYEVDTDLSIIARQGSGSACRSIYGGWVQWHKGTKSDGSDSIAKQIVPESHWPEMRVLVLVVNDSRKKYSSTSGMKQSVLTSELLKYRAEHVVPERVEQMLNAIQSKDFPTFAKLTMQDSNQFHAVCLDTYPPCVYMNDVSHAIVNTVHAYNEYKGVPKVAYTFDAGPNACIFLLEPVVGEFISLVNEVFPTELNVKDYVKGDVLPNYRNIGLRSKLNLENVYENGLKYIIYTKVGPGPKVMSV